MTGLQICREPLKLQYRDVIWIVQLEIYCQQSSMASVMLRTLYMLWQVLRLNLPQYYRFYRGEGGDKIFVLPLGILRSKIPSVGRVKVCT